MISVLGVLGALSMIASVAFGTVLAIAEGYDKRQRGFRRPSFQSPKKDLKSPLTSNGRSV